MNYIGNHPLLTDLSTKAELNGSILENFNVKDPILDDQAVNKRTLDNLVASITLSKANTLESQTGTDDEKYITPLRLFESLKGANQNFSSNGYQKLHGGLIIQWGQTPLNSTSANFPIAFPNAFLGISQSLEYNGISNITGFFNFTTTGFSLTPSSTYYRYIAIGF